MLLELLIVETLVQAQSLDKLTHGLDAVARGERHLADLRRTHLRVSIGDREVPVHHRQRKNGRQTMREVLGEPATVDMDVVQVVLQPDDASASLATFVDSSGELSGIFLGRESAQQDVCGVGDKELVPSVLTDALGLSKALDGPCDLPYRHMLEPQQGNPRAVVLAIQHRVRAKGNDRTG